MAQLALAGAVKLSAHIHTAKSIAEAINSGNVFGATMTLAQHIPLPSNTGGLGAAFVKSDSVDSSQQPIDMANISETEIADAVTRAKDEGRATIIHITADSNDSGSRALVIGNKDQVESDLAKLPNVPNIAAPWEVKKVIAIVKDIFHLTSNMLSLVGEGQLSQVLGATAGALGRLKASIKGVDSAALQQEPKLQNHQQLGNAVLRSQHTYKNQKGNTLSPKSALQLQLRADKINVRGGDVYAVLGATSDSATIKRVGAEGMTHTYFFTQVEGEPLGNMNSVEIITGIDPKTGKPCIAMSTHAGQDALQAALQNPAFDINNIPDLPKNLKIDVSPSNSLSSDNTPDDEKRDEAIAHQGASLSYSLSLTKDGTAKTVEESWLNAINALGGGALLELTEAELVECSEDYAILWNEKTQRAFVFVRGTESGGTSTTWRDVASYRFHLHNSPRGLEIREKVSKFFEANPHMAKNVIVSGHSLGGAIAVGIGMDHPTFKVYAFNPGGLPPTTTTEDLASDLLRIYFRCNFLFFYFNRDYNATNKVEVGLRNTPFTITATLNEDANAWKNIKVIQMSGDHISSEYAYTVNMTGGIADIREEGLWGLRAHSLDALRPDQNAIDAINQKYRNTP